MHAKVFRERHLFFFLIPRVAGRWGGQRMQEDAHMFIRMFVSSCFGVGVSACSLPGKGTEGWWRRVSPQADTVPGLGAGSVHAGRSSTDSCPV